MDWLGCEAAYQIAKRGVKVKLYEMKPHTYSPAHSNQDLAEIVCSNSFKSKLHTNACGLLKEELKKLDSMLIQTAEETEVPAGQALAVDREEFSKKVTEKIKSNPLIEVIRAEVKSKYAENQKEKNKISAKEIDGKIPSEQEEHEIYIEDLVEHGIVIIATGPLTSDALSVGIKHLIGENSLSFYDAAAPIIEKSSINFEIAFYGDRYEQERSKDESIEDWEKRIEKISKGSYINLPMNKQEYEGFVKELVEAEIVTLHEFEKREIFEGCMPIEIMAKRGLETLRFGPLKPVGFTDPRTGKRPYAVVQLRQDNSKATLYNMVGFQTNLKYGEQKRVFQMIPALENAEFVKYGVMHRNTYINSSILLDATYNMKTNKNVFFAGQITGVEGYVESISSGLVAGINAANKLMREKQVDETNKCEQNKANSRKCKKSKAEEQNNKKAVIFDERTMIGALAKYISTPNDNFQPMNSNYGILPELEEDEELDKEENEIINGSTNNNTNERANKDDNESTEKVENINVSENNKEKKKVKDKKLKYTKLSDRALRYLDTNI